MKIIKDEQTGQRWLEIGRFIIYPLYNQWQELRPQFAWANISFAKLEFELTYYSKKVELHVALFGFSWEVDYYYGKKEIENV